MVPVRARAGAETELCREHLATLLAEEIDALKEIEDLLRREHDVLGDKNVAAIERSALVRQEKMGHLARTEEQRRSLYSFHGYTADWIGLEGLMQWCDPEGTLVSRLRECAQRAVRCRDLNDRNGTLVAARLKNVEDRLATLSGRTNQPVVYGPNGSAARGNRSHEWGSV